MFPEPLEDAGEKLLVNARAVVFDFDDGPVPLLVEANTDQGSLRGMNDGVGDQVGEYSEEGLLISFNEDL